MGERHGNTNVRAGGGGGKTLLLPLALLTLAAAAIAAIIAADLTPPAQAQSEDETTGRIVARRLATGRVEFGWQPTGGERVLPQSRYFPADPGHNRWLRSSPVEVGGVELGRINARLRADGRIEFAFTPTGGERIAPQSRYFPHNARIGRWLRSTEITIGPPADEATGYSAVDVGANNTCAIRESDSAIECWGRNWYYDDGLEKHESGQIDPPAGSFRAVSVGHYYTCAIRDTGEIACWGLSDAVKRHTGAGNYTAVSVGEGHTCAIRESDSAIECWGFNREGQANAPAGRYTAVAAGIDHTCAIREDKTIKCWGDNALRQLGYRDTRLFGPANEAPAGGVHTISAGWSHTCAIRDTGDIACWGYSDAAERPTRAGNYTAVSVGESHTCAIQNGSGPLECWVWNSFRNQYGEANAPAGNFRAMSAGRDHTCAIRSEDGAIVCWGSNFYQQFPAPPQ